jgi:dUTPase
MYYREWFGDRKLACSFLKATGAVDYIYVEKPVDIFRNASDQTLKYTSEDRVLQSYLLSLFDDVSEMAVSRFESALW